MPAVAPHMISARSSQHASQKWKLNSRYFWFVISASQPRVYLLPTATVKIMRFPFSFRFQAALKCSWPALRQNWLAQRLSSDNAASSVSYWEFGITLTWGKIAPPGNRLKLLVSHLRRMLTKVWHVPINVIAIAISACQAAQRMINRERRERARESVLTLALNLALGCLTALLALTDSVAVLNEVLPAFS